MKYLESLCYIFPSLLVAKTAAEGTEEFAEDQYKARTICNSARSGMCVYCHTQVKVGVLDKETASVANTQALGGL
jgi:hypothetical protein